MNVSPFLCFEGRCQEAIDFYQQAVDAEILGLRRFSDAPEGKAPPGSPDKVLHACLKIGSTKVFISDGRCSGTPHFQGMSLFVEAENDEQARKLFSALSAHGEVRQELAPTFFSSSFGICADRFGVGWMVLSLAPVPAA